MEFILRVLACSVSHTLPAGTITSLSDYNGPPAVLPVYKNTPRVSLAEVLHTLLLFPSSNLSPSPFQRQLSPALTRHWKEGGCCPPFSGVMFSRRRPTGAWKPGCSPQVATGWAHLPLNSLWQVRSQPRGGARRPAERREACGCSGSAFVGSTSSLETRWLRVEHLVGYRAVIFLLERNDESLEMGHWSLFFLKGVHLVLITFNDFH